MASSSDRVSVHDEVVLNDLTSTGVPLQKSSSVVTTWSDRKKLKVNFLNIYNSVAFQIPMVNLLWVYVDSGLTGSTSWAQYDSLLIVLSLVSALILALISAFHSCVTFDEMQLTDARFALVSNNSGFRQIDNLYYDNNYAIWWTGDGSGQMGKSLTVTQEFNMLCCLSSFLLCDALLLSVLVLAVTATAPMAKPDANAEGSQYRVVLSAYMRYVSWVVYVIIGCAALGASIFFQILKSMFYIKFPDQWVEALGDSQKWPFSKETTTYGYANSSVIWLCYVPMIIGILALSAGQRAAYSYPLKPATLLGDSGWDKTKREQARKILVTFLVNACHLPATSTTKHVVMLTAVGGGSVNDAEVVADALIDQGILTLEDFKLYMSHSGGAIFDVPGISVGAASQISWEFEFGNANSYIH
eukprot:m.259158 g.259158  ORF g.259158 m.259158 type:complete len:414 (-) comp37630_c0_seq1:348-1589(-)